MTPAGPDAPVASTIAVGNYDADGDDDVFISAWDAASNAYTARLSPTVVGNLLAELMPGPAGRITAGEVGLPARSDGKVLPCGIYGRWEAAS